MKNLIKRSITGLVFVAVMVSCIMWNAYSLGALLYVLSILGLWEFYKLVLKGNYRPQYIAGTLSATLIFAVVLLIKLEKMNPFFLTLIFPFLVIIFISELFRAKRNPFANIAFTILGIVYIVFPFALINLLTYESDGGYNPYLVLGYFILIWLNDTSAFVVGSLIGRNPLYQSISPKKTWEGFIGGVIFCLIGAYLLSFYYTEIKLRHWFAIGAIVSIFGTLGDLVESMLKRSLNIKDSGNLLPGHGGVLDRFDGVFLTSPLVYSYLAYIIN